MHTSDTATSQRGKRRGEAFEFDRIASGFLGSCGFGLKNDPCEISTPYLGNKALYESPRGLFLGAGFEPADGHSAALSCGRLWTVDGRYYGLSGSYSDLAGAFGFELPSWYRLGVGDQVMITLNTMLQDLMDSLPIVLGKVSLADLDVLERAEKGIARAAEARRSLVPGMRVTVSDFR